VKDQRHIDIWQLGLLLFKLLTKIDPFDRLEGTALTDKIASGAIFIPKFISEEGRAFLGLMLNVNPDLRPSAEDIIKHPWMKRGCPAGYPLVSQTVDIDRQALKKMSTGFKVDRKFHSRMIESLISNEKNWLTAK
jgi:serine/threonine protein kinase